MKYMKAEQCADGYHFSITETGHAHTLADLKAIARHEGLRMDDTALNEIFITNLEHE